MSKKISAVFWVIWVVALFWGFVEFFTYTGFVTRHLGVSLQAMVAFVGFLAGLVLILRLIKKDSTYRKSDKIVSLFFAFLLTFYVILKIVNRLTNVSFVLSNLHIQPDTLTWPVVISMLPVAIAWIPRINFRKLLKIQSVFVAFAFLIIALNLRYIYKSEWPTFQFILSHPLATYGDKMRKAIGDIFYNYALFIDKYTPENASLLIPPQAFPWPDSGNEGYFRYFVYPRNIRNGNEFEPPSKDVFDKIDYVLLNWGETDMVQFPHTHDWPKFDVKAEKIIFMNEDGSFGGEVSGNYYYKDYKGKRVWGLIVVKH